MPGPFSASFAHRTSGTLRTVPGSTTPAECPAIEKFVMVIATSHRLGESIRRKLMESASLDFELPHAQVEVLHVDSAVLEAVRKAAQSGTFSSSNRDRLPNHVMLSKQLRSIRLQKNISTFELSKKSGLPLEDLAGYEQGWQQPDPTALQRLAVALEVQMNELRGIAAK